jgi:hypothetical protein
MRRLLGKITLFLLLGVTLYADYSWSVSTSKREFYVNEAVEIVLKCEFSDSGYGYNIELEGLQNSAYEMHLLSQKESMHTGVRINEYRFVMFVAHAGELPLAFNAVMKRTTKESIENSVIGRDNVEELAFTSKRVALPELHLHVKHSPLLLVGNFELDVVLSAQSVEAYKPLNITVTLKGEGSFDKLKPYELKIKNAEVFAQVPLKFLKLTPRGFEGSITQQFAVVAKESYEIAPFELEYFNPKTQSVEKKSSRAYAIGVSDAYSKEELLDAEPSKDEDTQEAFPLLSYLAVLFAGVIAGRFSTRMIARNTLSRFFVAIDNFIWRVHSDVGEPKKFELIKAINTCKNEKSLQVLLIVSDEVRFRSVIELLSL